MEQPHKLRIMSVAARLHKTTRELLRDCTAAEISEWITFFRLQDKPPKTATKADKLRKVFAQQNKREKMLNGKVGFSSD